MQLEKKWLMVLAVALALGAGASNAAAQDVAVPDLIDSAVLFAVVESNGVLQRGNGAVSSTGFGGGAYEVIFNRSVTACAYKATVGRPGGAGSTGGPGEIVVVGRAGNANGVFLQSYDSAGGGSVRPFHLTVAC